MLFFAKLFMSDKEKRAFSDLMRMAMDGISIYDYKPPFEHVEMRLDFCDFATSLAGHVKNKKIHLQPEKEE